MTLDRQGSLRESVFICRMWRVKHGILIMLTKSARVVVEVMSVGNLGFPNPVPNRFSGAIISEAGLTAMRQSVNSHLSSDGTLLLKRARGPGVPSPQSGVPHCLDCAGRDSWIYSLVHQ